MALDSTAKEMNVVYSLKKFLIDNLTTIEGIQILFDKSSDFPNVRDLSLERWISVVYGEMERSYLSAFPVSFFCCTRKDEEGDKLIRLCDTLMGYFSDTTKTDGLKRIPFYEVSTWTLIGSMVVDHVDESGKMEDVDGLSFKILTPRLRWGAKI